jgi:hypothetical protein
MLLGKRVVLENVIFANEMFLLTREKIISVLPLFG